jgi:hypothetical protein
VEIDVMEDVCVGLAGVGATEYRNVSVSYGYVV